ncbi:MAG: mycothiol system anti-sigma-R factor [Bifidobacteriaceae bacterium]|jgi:mycothiol system anti-sigma-R factor|nr:mycothiol system anti-sigma-R factor [Bifidobacteriaceae bacterium]
METLFQQFGCEEALPRLYRFIDEELDEHELEAMRDHLDGCDNCAYEHEVRTKLKSVIREACLDAAPPSLRAKVVDRLTELRAGGAQPA